MCQVVNFKQYGSVVALNQAFGGHWLYIGRENRTASLHASPLANPFKVKDFGGRGQTLPHYRRWLWGRIQAEDTAVLSALQAINEQTILVCWCKPSPCHGDVVKAAAAWVQTQPCYLNKLGTEPERSERKQPTAFISGHRDITPAEFYQHYLAALDEAVAAGHYFVVGDAPGVDRLAQMYLFGRVSSEQVTVYHAGRMPRYHTKIFPVQGGFASQTAKDAAMTAVSDYDIAWVRPGKQSSGTAHNLARR